MKFNLPQQETNKTISSILRRELKRQKIKTLTASKEDLKGIATVAISIKREGLPKHLVRKKLPGKLGYGIFLRADAPPIQAGEVIAPYAGEVSLVPRYWEDDTDYAFEPLADLLLTREEQALLDPKSPFRPNRLYAMKLDALKKGNFTRFINHSGKPNVEALLVTIKPNRYGVAENPAEIVYFANKTIRPGEQILVSYEAEEKTYWGALGIKPFPITPTTFRLSRSSTLINNAR